MSIFKKNAETDTQVRYESAETVPRDTVIGSGTMIEGIISSRRMYAWKACSRERS